MDNSVFDVLPAVQSFTRCYTTTKVGTKSAAFQATMKCSYELMSSLGKSEISDQMILSPEKSLVECISRSSERNNFDQVRFETYHQISFQLDLEKLPPTWSSIHIHIKRAFLQCYLWLHALFVESTDINPENYGYELTEDDMLVPTITSKDVIPEDFPVPCNCLKCAKKNVCPHRVKLIRSCELCKCEASSNCNNTFN